MFSLTQSSHILNERLSHTIATSIFLFLLAPLGLFLLDFYHYHRKPCDVPVINLEGWQYEKAKKNAISNFAYYLKLGRESSRSMPTLLWGTEGYLAILPEKYVEELKSLDDSIVDNSPLMKNIFSDYDWFHLAHFPAVRRAISAHLTPKLASFMPVMTSETSYALETEVPACDEWTSMNVNATLLRLVSVVAGRIFVGPELNRNPDWINASIQYTTDVFMAGRTMRGRTYLGKVLGCKLGTVKEIQKVSSWKRVAEQLIVPIIQERSKLLTQKVNAEIPNDMITWIMEQGGPGGALIPYADQAHLQLLVGLAAIHTTTLTATNVLFDLVARPEYITPLREEVEAVWKESNGLDKTSMSKLVKMDSFVKESQRLNPHAQVTFDRQVSAKNGFTLSNGLHLRKGAHVTVASNQMSLDPKIWDKPDEFHGFRFADLRSASKENANKFQFAATHPANSMYFGYGKHDCPGRFFASNEIKTILAHLIYKYDIKAHPGFQRPEPIRFASRMQPNPTICILIRKREGSF